MTETGPVIVFDGYCVLCDGWVSFVIAHDPKRRFRYASLQSKSGQALLNGAGPTALSGEFMVLVENDRAYEKSTAALQILAGLGLPWSLLRILKIIPPFVRDTLYDFVARNRYRWFGRRSSCRVPTPKEQELFLE